MSDELVLIDAGHGVEIRGDFVEKEPSRSILVYVASRYTSKTRHQRESFMARAEATGIAIYNAGYSILIPTKNTYDFEHYDPDPENWIEMDLVLLGRCDILCLPYDWRESNGCRTEYQYARSVVLPIWTAVKPL